jgi:hypothetical protein
MVDKERASTEDGDQRAERVASRKEGAERRWLPCSCCLHLLSSSLPPDSAF